MNKEISRRYLKAKAYKEIKELDRNEIHIAINEFFNTIEEVFLCGNGINFYQFGGFLIKRYNIGKKHDLQTGKMVDHGSRNKVIFKVTKKLKKLANRK